MARPPMVDTAAKWEGQANIQGFPHEVVIEYKDGQEVSIQAENEFFKMFFHTLPWADLNKFASDEVIVGPRSALTQRLLKCLVFEPNPKDNRKKLLRLENPPVAQKMVRKLKQSQSKSGGWVSPVALRKNKSDRPTQLLRHMSSATFRKTQLQREMESLDLDRGTVEVNFVPHRMKAAIKPDGAVVFIGLDDFDKLVKVEVSREEVVDLLQGSDPKLLRKGKELEMLTALEKLMTYADLHNDPRRKQLTLQKKPSRSVRMTRKKVSSGKHGKSGRGDKVIIRDVALMSKGISSFRRALNTRAGSARARALWGRVANHLRVVLHLDPGLSKCIDGSFKFNRSMFVGAALMLQEAADLGCEARVAHPYKFWKQLGRANYEAFRCTLMPMFLDRAHVALQRALVFLANLSSVDVWLSTGMVYVRHASWKGAAQVFARIIQDYPRYDAMNEVVFQAACVMAQLNMLKQGLAYFQAVLGRPPKPYAELHVQLAMAQLQRAAGMEGIATDTFRDVHKQLKRRKKKRQEARWQRIFGVVEAERGRLKPRRLMFPPHGVLARMKALDDMLGESAKAAETADEWLATGRPWALMGQLFAARGDEVIGLAFFRTAFQRLAHSDRTHALLMSAARCHAAIKDTATAVSLAEEVHSQDPTFGNVQQCLKVWAPEKYGAPEPIVEPDERLDNIQLRRQEALAVIADKTRRHQHEAAICIQRVARGKAGREKAAATQHRQRSAVKIQAAARGRADRARVDALRKQHAAAKDIQRVARGNAGRARVEALRRERELRELSAAEAEKVLKERAQAEADRKAKQRAEAEAREQARRDEAAKAALAEREAEEEARRAAAREKRAAEQARKERLALEAQAKKKAAHDRKLAEAEAEAARQRAREEQREREVAAARRIQRGVRSHLARKNMYHLRSELHTKYQLSQMQRAESERRRIAEERVAAARLEQVERQRRKEEAARAAKEQAARAQEAEARRVRDEQARREKDEAARAAIAKAQAEAKRRMAEEMAVEAERREARDLAATQINRIARGHLGRKRVQGIVADRANAALARSRELERVKDLEARRQALQHADATRAAALAAEMAMPLPSWSLTGGMGGSMGAGGGFGSSDQLLDLTGGGGSGMPVMPAAPLFSPPAVLMAGARSSSPPPPHATLAFTAGDGSGRGSGSGRGGMAPEPERDEDVDGAASQVELAPPASRRSLRAVHARARSPPHASLTGSRRHRSPATTLEPRSRSRGRSRSRSRGRGAAASSGHARRDLKSRSRSRSPGFRGELSPAALAPLDTSAANARGGSGASSFLPDIKSPHEPAPPKVVIKGAVDDPTVQRSPDRRRSTGSGPVSADTIRRQLEGARRPNTTGSVLETDGTLSPHASGSDRRRSTRHNVSPLAATPNGSYTPMSSVRHLAFLDPTGDSGEVRWNTLRQARRTGFTGSSSQPYLKHWRRQLAALMDQFATVRHMRRCVAEVRSAHPTIDNEQAFCALADCNGDVRLAIGRLVDEQFVAELQSLVRVVDVTGFVSDRFGSELAASPAAATTATSGGAGGGGGVATPPASHSRPYLPSVSSPASPVGAGDGFTYGPPSPHTLATASRASSPWAVASSLSMKGEFGTHRHMSNSASLPTVGLRRSVLEDTSHTPPVRRRARRADKLPAKKFNPRVKKPKQTLTAEARAALAARQAGTAERMMKGHSCNKKDCLDCMMARLQARPAGQLQRLN